MAWIVRIHLTPERKVIDNCYEWFFPDPIEYPFDTQEEAFRNGASAAVTARVEERDGAATFYPAHRISKVQVVPEGTE